MILLVCKQEALHIIKKEEHLISQVNVSSINGFDTLSMLKSVYFFIANTNKVDNSKMIAMSLRTFITKVLFFILSTSFLLQDWRTTLTSNIPIRNYIISVFIKQEN